MNIERGIPKDAFISAEDRLINSMEIDELRNYTHKLLAEYKALEDLYHGQITLMGVQEDMFQRREHYKDKQFEFTLCSREMFDKHVKSWYGSPVKEEV